MAGALKRILLFVDMDVSLVDSSVCCTIVIVCFALQKLVVRVSAFKLQAEEEKSDDEKEAETPEFSPSP